MIKEDMRGAIDYFVEKVNRPLAKAIMVLGMRYPEPTHENVWHPNSRRLLNLRDEFYECWAENPLTRILWKILIVKYEHSPNWQHYLDWFIMKIPEDWKPFNPNRQMECWRRK